MGGGLTTVCLLLAGSVFGQQTMLSAPDAMDAIYKQYRGKLPACLDVVQARKAAEDDIQWLSRRFAQTGWSHVGPEYVASLNDLLDSLRLAADNRDIRGACERVLAVMRDIHIKRNDCREIGHSRTNVPVEIEIKRGRQAVSDWEVYTLWIPAGDRFTTVPKRLQGLSSPARGTVPVPGEYELVAKDPSGLSTKPIRVSIGGAEVFNWSLQIPAPQGQPAKK